MVLRRRLSDLPLVGAAFGGVLLGHWLGYLVAMPDGTRDHFLGATGHGYWMSAVKLAVALVLVALAGLGRRHARSVFQPGSGADPGPWSIAARLAGMQVLGFVALEVAERLAAGAPLATLFQHQVLVLGVLVQILVGGVLGLVLFLFTRAVRAAARALIRGPLPRPVPRFLPPFQSVALRPTLVAGSSGPRSPPSL